MSATGLEVFDTTLQQTNTWLKAIMTDLGWEDRHRAYLGLRGTLHALRDHLTVDESAHLSAQLPMLVRGLYFEGWDPSQVPVRERHLEQFLRRVESAFTRGPALNVAPEQIARAVFRALAEHVSAGEAEQVRNMLPAEVRELWPQGVGVRS